MYLLLQKFRQVFFFLDQLLYFLCRKSCGFGLVAGLLVVQFI
jgi:hypothetical protein